MSAAESVIIAEIGAQRGIALRLGLGVALDMLAAIAAE